MMKLWIPITAVDLLPWWGDPKLSLTLPMSFGGLLDTSVNAGEWEMSYVTHRLPSWKHTFSNAIRLKVILSNSWKVQPNTTQRHLRYVQVNWWTGDDQALRLKAQEEKSETCIYVYLWNQIIIFFISLCTFSVNQSTYCEYRNSLQLWGFSTDIIVTSLQICIYE